MHPLLLFVGLAVPILATEEEMGPAAFLWPPDRAWSAHIDNHAPCGSVEGPGKRVEFPLSMSTRTIPLPSIAGTLTSIPQAGGRISLVAQDDSYETMIGISYKNGKPHPILYPPQHLTPPPQTPVPNPTSPP